jgi:hypothetical protein
VTVSATPTGLVDDVDIVSVGIGVLVGVDHGRIDMPLTVTFVQATAPADSSLVALHRADDGTWNLIPATTAGAPLEQRRLELAFSRSLSRCRSCRRS